MPQVQEEAANHYWSYRALLEDKKRCLTDIPHVRHDQCNSLAKEGEDMRKSQKAMNERIRHMGMDLKTNWDPNGRRTPPHPFDADKNRPHYSARELSQEKKRMQTGIREREKRPQSARASSSVPNLASPNSRAGSGGDADEWWKAPTMTQLMKPGALMDGAPDTERDVLQERRASNDPHSGHALFTMKKRFHATKIHQSNRRAQSARELGRSSSSPRETPPDSEAGGYRRDPTNRSYQGNYPHGYTSEAFPEGRSDPKKPGRYTSQAYFEIDKRRHAARVDGDAHLMSAKLNEVYQDSGKVTIPDANGYLKPDFTARDEKYRSQYALTQHKKRHLAILHSDGDKMVRAASYTPQSIYDDGAPQQDLFTSHKSLDYGKRGHVVSLNSARKSKKNEAEDGASSVGSSSCDVGKGISSMMHKHRDKDVHTSQAEFFLKKKNHATSVMLRPRDPSEKSVASEDSGCGVAVFTETRRQSNPHNSCKAFALKKKYHQTNVHVTDASRLHPSATKEKPLERNPKTLVSQTDLNKLKKIHSFVYNPDEREKPKARQVPSAPVPRNGQWTPQHVMD